MKRDVMVARRVTLVVSILLLIGFSQLSFAQGYGKMLKQYPPMVPGEMMAERLGIQGKVKDKFLKLMSEFRSKKMTFHLELKKLKLELAELLREEPVSSNKVKAKIDQIVKLKNRFMMYKVKLLNDLRKILPLDKYRMIRDHFIKHWVLKEHGGHGMHNKCNCGMMKGGWMRW